MSVSRFSTAHSYAPSNPDKTFQVPIWIEFCGILHYDGLLGPSLALISTGFNLDILLIHLKDFFHKKLPTSSHLKICCKTVQVSDVIMEIKSSPVWRTGGSRIFLYDFPFRLLSLRDFLGHLTLANRSGTRWSWSFYGNGRHIQRWANLCPGNLLFAWPPLPAL